jgi:hypothetical protein
MSDLTDLRQAILCGDKERAEEAARRAMAAEVDPAHLFAAGVVAALDEARRRFQADEYYVPEMLIACRAMKAAMSQIRPRLEAGAFRPAARVCVITLAHQDEDITGSLVAGMLEGAGFQVTNSTLAVPEAERAEQWRIADAALVVLVEPTVAFSRGASCCHSPARDDLARLFGDHAQRGGKVVLVGGNSLREGDFQVDAHIDDFADIVPAAERLLQNAGLA